MGTGINKIKQLCFENNIPEPEFLFNDFFTVIFKRNTLNDGLNKRQKNTLKEIINYPVIKGKELSEQLNIPIDTIDRYIKVFTTKNLVERKGSKKTGGYFMLEK